MPSQSIALGGRPFDYHPPVVRWVDQWTSIGNCGTYWEASRFLHGIEAGAIAATRDSANAADQA